MRNHTGTNANGYPPRSQYIHLLAGGEITDGLLAALQTDAGLWDVAWRDGVGASLWHALRQQGGDVDADIRAASIEQPLRWQMTHTLMLRAAAKELLQLFAAAGIGVVMLRGQTVADVLYSPPTLRPQTDIDLLIAVQDMQRCWELLKQAGFFCLPGHPMLFARGEVLLDVHTEPLGIERIPSWALLTPLRGDDFFRCSQPGTLLGEPAILPDAGVCLPYLCFHAMKHSFERLIWLLDIALLARRIDAEQGWDEVQAGIARYALQRPCFYALSYAWQHLSAPVPERVLDALRQRMDWRERVMFRRFMQHEQVPFLAERVFARMQPDLWHRMIFWKQTIWPGREIRLQVDANPSAQGGFFGKRLRQIWRAAVLLLGELGALFRT